MGPGAPFETGLFEAVAVDAGCEGLRTACCMFAFKALAEKIGFAAAVRLKQHLEFSGEKQIPERKCFSGFHESRAALAGNRRRPRLGIEVFVIDTGSYGKTGDGAVSRRPFPEGLAEGRKTQRKHGMRPALWLNPQPAAASSPPAAQLADCCMSWRGRPAVPHPVRETKPNHRMRQVSRYTHAFADALIRLYGEPGATCFRWDAVDGHGCDNLGRWRGDASRPAGVRTVAYAFQLPPAAQRIARRVAEAVPDAIFDFDVTEEGRPWCGGGVVDGAGPRHARHQASARAEIPRSPGVPSCISMRRGAPGWSCCSTSQTRTLRSSKRTRALAGGGASRRPVSSGAVSGVPAFSLPLPRP